MKKRLAWLLSAALVGPAAAATVTELQAQFKATLQEIGQQRQPGMALLDLSTQVTQQTGPWQVALYGALSRAWDGNPPFAPGPVPAGLPDWARAPLAEWVAGQGWPAAPVSAPERPHWQQFGEEKPVLSGGAWVLAGPAVKARVALYRREAADTVARLGVDDGQASLWLAAAKALGWGVQLKLRDNPPPEEFADMLVRATFEAAGGAPRVWLVTPGGLVEARLLRMHFGGRDAGCESWIELRLPGAAEPAVWALLALADPRWVAGATVQRLPAATPDAIAESQRGELRLNLPAARGLPALRLRASRYDFVSSDAEAEPDASGMPPAVKRGEAWGVRAWPDDVFSKPDAAAYSLPLSASGSPRCPVR